MNTNSSVSYPDVDAAAVDWSAMAPRFAEWQDQHVYNLATKALDILNSDYTDAYKRGYSKTIFHTIRNIVCSKAQDKKQM